MKDYSQAAFNAEPKTIWNRNFVFLFLSNCFLYLSLTMMNSLVSKYANYLSSNEMVVGVVSGVFAYSAIILKAFSGPALDTFNKKLILIFSMFTIALSFWGYSFSDTIPELIVFRILQGAGQAFSATCCLTLAAQFVPEDKMGSGIGYFSLGQITCKAIAPTLALYAEELWGYQYSFMLGASLMMVGTFTIFFIEWTAKVRKKFKISFEGLFCKEAVPSAILMLFSTMPYYAANSFLLIYGEQLGLKIEIGWFFVIYAVAIFIIRPFAGKMLDAHGFLVVLIPSFACFALSLIVISAASNMLHFTIAAVLFASGYGIGFPTIQTLAMKAVAPERRGASSCVTYFGYDIASIVGPILAGKAAAAYGYPAMWCIMIIPLGIAFSLLFTFRKKLP